MSDATLRAGIKTILTGVPGAGTVHDYECWIVNTDEFLEQFRDAASGWVMGWEITRTQVKTERMGGMYKVTSKYRLKGYYALQDADATEEALQAIVDALIAAFLAAKIPGTQGRTLPRAKRIGVRMFGTVLCHHAEIVLPGVAEIVAPADDNSITDLLMVGLNYYLTPGDADDDAADVVNLPELPKD